MKTSDYAFAICMVIAVVGLVTVIFGLLLKAIGS